MEPIVHYALPVLFLLALGRADRNKVIRYSPLAVVADLDFFLGHTFLHNIFMPLAISSLVYHLSGRDRAAWMLSMFFLYSHLVLDLGFVALLYPVYDSIISVNINFYTSPKVIGNIMDIVTGKGAFENEFSAIVKSDSNFQELPLDAARNAPISPFFTNFGLMVILLFLMTVALNRYAVTRPADKG